MKKTSDESLPLREVDKREKDVLTHFLNSKPSAHKPRGKNPQAKRRKREKQKAKP